MILTMLNRVDLAGLVVQPPTVKFTPNGFAYGDMTVEAGLPDKPATPVQVAVHVTGEAAQLAGEHLKPGDGIILWGAFSQATSRRGGIRTVSLRVTAEGFIRTTLAATGVTLNRVNLYGQLQQDAEVGLAGANGAQCDLVISVPIPGERREVASVPVRVAGRLGALCAKQLHAGDEVLVWGYVTQQTWREGQAESSRLRVVAVGVQPAGGDVPDRVVAELNGRTASGDPPLTAVGHALQEAVRQHHGGK